MNPFGNSLGNIVQKAFYLGVGLASLATEKAGSTLTELRTEATKLADELVKRGEMSSEEARKFVDDMVAQAQQGRPDEDPKERLKDQAKSPRTIDIDDGASDDFHSSASTPDDNLDGLKDKVRSLQEELKRMQK
jgi:polyhydroxyalkanoate synthesis regulator phasin